MSPKAIVAALLSMAAVGQIHAAPRDTDYRTPTVTHVNFQKGAAAQAPKGHKPAAAAQSMEARKPGAPGAELRAPEIDEQFTRMSCCP